VQAFRGAPLAPDRRLQLPVLGLHPLQLLPHRAQLLHLQARPTQELNFSFRVRVYYDANVGKGPYHQPV